MSIERDNAAQVGEHLAMTPVRRNLIANFTNNIWTALVWLVATPFYISALGIEGFGFVALFNMLLVLLAPADFGLGVAFNREIARRMAKPDDALGTPDVVRTVERIFWGIALAIGLGIGFAAPWLGERWVTVRGMTAAQTHWSIVLMGVLLAAQWPLAVYTNGLMGMQRQVTTGVIGTIASTVRYLGVLPVLWWVSSTVQAFFLWQTAVCLIQIGVQRSFLWRSLPEGQATPRFRVDSIRQFGRFALGAWFISGAATLTVLMDRLAVSKLMSIEDFGYYSVAVMVAGAMTTIFAAIFGALYPRFSELVALEHREELAELYHAGAQVMAVLCLPLGAAMAFFSRELLLLWTGNPQVAEYAWRPLAILAPAMALAGLMNVGYALQLSYGWTRLALAANLAVLALAVPAVPWLVLHWGLAGAATSVLLMYGGYVVIVAPIMHRRLLRGHLAAWYLRDNLIPLLATLAVLIPLRVFLPVPLSRSLGLFVFPLAVVCAMIVAGLTAGHVRRNVGTVLRATLRGLHPLTTTR